MIASLPMYDIPSTQTANDELWEGIQQNLGFGPAHLTRSGDSWKDWYSSDLLLSQTCGLPFRTELFGHVALVATPDYGLPDCPPGYYFSVVVARAGAPDPTPERYESLTLALNEPGSQSGWAAAAAHAAQFGTEFRKAVATGAHHASALAVAAGDADLAFIDAVTWRLIQRDPALRHLRIVDRTTPTPGLPLITARHRDPAPIARAVGAAIAQLSPGSRKVLGLRGVARIPEAAYMAVLTPPKAPVS